ncbi:MAG: Hsp20/alpha crystallin family protein [Woeseiaceae bacterium]|nr:Hsp20/alpha crystallin family protein [Woeseiaceae bacterium]
MNIAGLEPWNLINCLHRDLDTLAERRFGRYPHKDDDNVFDWMPAVDVVEEQNRFVLRADLPGVSVDDIDLRMENGMLTIAGERARESRDHVDGVQRFERSTGKFFRRFSLPETVDAENISARSNNGILEIVIPKQPEVQARRITVEAA